MTTLPALAGSEKQIAWAEDLRTKKIAALEAHLENVYAYARKKGMSEEKIAEQKVGIDANLAKLTAKTSAAWWIEFRALAAHMLLQEVLVNG